MRDCQKDGEMKITLRKVALLVLSVYFVFSFYTGYLLIKRKFGENEKDVGSMIGSLGSEDSELNAWESQWQRRGGGKHAIFEGAEPLWHDSRSDDAGKVQVIEVWGKAAIGLYFWQHIFRAGLEDRLGGVWQYGEKNFDNLIFRFRTGPGVVPEKVPQHVEHLVLILNGREPAKVEFAQMWLDSLPSYPLLRNVAVVLLGNEQCNNEWIYPYLVSNGGMVHMVFVVYDSMDIDDHNFYQWPLGVATYRDFPVVNPQSVSVSSQRAFRCNFVGTVYANSSREQLLRVIRDHQLQHQCFIKPRLRWEAQETLESRSDYIEALKQSDLTLNPAGVNTECYRIYEALALGSVPVIEDHMTRGACGNTSTHQAAPLGLLREHKVPVIYVKDWRQLPDILRREGTLTTNQIKQRRAEVLKWYEHFKDKMRERFIRVISKRFFGWR